jgi:hypothetical protein
VGISTTALNDGVVNVPYSQTLSASGANGTLTWSLKSGTLPAGLSLSAGGLISGTPTTATTGTGASVTIQVEDSGPPDQTISQNFTIRIASPLAITSPGTLPDATVGVPYSATLQASGGISPFTWSLTTGSLPAGLGLSSGGTISGTPTAASASTSFGVTANDSSSPAQSTTQTLAIHVATKLAVTTVALADGRVGSPYVQNLAATGGTGTYSWSLASGTLPTGLTLSATGVISGTPTTVNLTGSMFSVQARDSGSPAQTAAATYTIRIAAPLAITTASLPAGKFGVAYSATLATSGGIGTVTWTLAAGSGPLPAGLTLSATGAISGTPSAFGTFAFTVQATDSGLPAQSATKALSIAIAPAYTLSFAVQPSNTSPNAQITPAIKVAVVDAKGKAVSGVTVVLAIAVNPGNSVLSGTTVAVTGNNGVAIFASNSLNNDGIGYVLQASAPNLPGAAPVLSAPFNIQ